MRTELLLHQTRMHFPRFDVDKIDIGIVKQRRQIVFRQTGAHSLEINQICLAIPDDDVLRLKIPMHEHARESGQPLRDLI